MHKPLLAGLVATAVLTCLVALDAAGDSDHARQREAAGTAIGTPSDKVADRGPDARVAVRNVQLASAPPVDEEPSAFVRFDVFNEGEQDVSPVVVEIAILETPPRVGEAVPLPTPLVGPFRIRAKTALKAGYSVHYELRLRNVFASCDCIATVDVVQDDSGGQPPHLFEVN